MCAVPSKNQSLVIIIYAAQDTHEHKFTVIRSCCFCMEYCNRYLARPAMTKQIVV